MTPGRTSGAPGVVVVTGVSRYLGAHVAARLAADPRIERVIGLDAADPAPELAPLLDQVDRVRADAASVGTVIDDLAADSVVHLALATAPDQQHGGRAAMKEQNVIGTMQLLAACQRAPRLRRLVVRSSTAAYGASFRDPAVFTEETEPHAVPRGGFARDILDIEGYVRGFRRRRPDVTATVLRFAPFIGSTADTTLTRYFAQPVVPTVLGRDPRLQFVHIEDALEVLHRSVTEEHAGHVQRGRSGRTRALPGDPASRPGRRTRAGTRPVRRGRDRPRPWGSGATAWTRSTSSCTAGWSTPPDSAPSTASPRAPPPPRSTTSSPGTPTVRWSAPTSSPVPNGRSWTGSVRYAPP